MSNNVLSSLPLFFPLPLLLPPPLSLSLSTSHTDTCTRALVYLSLSKALESQDHRQDKATQQLLQQYPRYNRSDAYHLLQSKWLSAHRPRPSEPAPLFQVYNWSVGTPTLSDRQSDDRTSFADMSHHTTTSGVSSGRWRFWHSERPAVTAARAQRTGGLT